VVLTIGNDTGSTAAIPRKNEREKRNDGRDPEGLN
jgi:hypothetical protein